MELIKTVDLHKSFGDLHVLQGVNQTIHKGEVISIIGPSGAGKSTLVRCINLLERPSEGKVLFHGSDLMGLKEKDLRLQRRKISMIFQSFNLLDQRTNLDNISGVINTSRFWITRRNLSLLLHIPLHDGMEQPYDVLRIPQFLRYLIGIRFKLSFSFKEF